jgi:hypothetical protein
MFLRFNCVALAISLALVTNLAQAACFADSPLTRPDERYQAVEGSNGGQVKDTQTGLVWQRCVLGQAWDGAACTGNLTPQDWPSATKAAAAAKPWRLPTQAELQDLIEKSCSKPALNNNWFGSGPMGWFWTATDMGSPDGSVVINTENGLVANLIKKLPLYVRWVR